MKKEIRRKIALFLAILTMVLSLPIDQISAAEEWDYVETFDNVGSSGSYIFYELNGVHNGTWIANGARDASGTGYTIDGQGVTLGGKTADNSSLSTTVTDGIGRISIDFKKAYTSDNTRNYGLYVNDSTTPIATVNATNATTPVTMTADINIEGSVKITIKPIFTNSKRAQVTIDNIKWTKYPSAPSGGGTGTDLSISPTELNFEYYSSGDILSTKQLTLTGVPQGATVTWSSSMDAVATVDSNGLVTAWDAGNATITAEAGGKTATCNVLVFDIAPLRVKFYMDESLTEEYKSEIVLQENKVTKPTQPTKTGYTFENWYWKPNGTEEVFDFNQAIVDDANIYAKWTATQEQISTIAQARATVGEVTTQGIVTFFDANTVVIQDDTAGIAIYPKSSLTAVNSDLAIGDKIKLTGTIGAYNGLMQIQSPTNITRISQNNTLPQPQEVTIATLLSNAEDYESERVLIKGTTIGSYSSGQWNTNLTQDGATIPMFKIPGLSAGIAANDRVDVTAVASQFSKTDPNSGYQLRVAKVEDIVKVTGTDPGTPASYKSDIFTEEFLNTHSAKLIPEVLALPDKTPSTVAGVAVYSYSGGNALIIQDYVNGEIVGYQIYAPTENVKMGDIVVVSGNRVKWYDTDETSGVTGMKMIDPKSLNMTTEQKAKYDLVCAPQVVTKDMIVQGQEKYYNEYLRINDLTLPQYADGQVYFKYQDGSSLQAYRIPEYPIGTKAGDVVDILCAGAVHSGKFQVRLNDYTDYIIKDDKLAPFVVVPEFLDAKAGQDYNFQIEIIDNVKVTDAKAFLVNANGYEITLQRDEITGAYKGTIPADKFSGLTELELKFEATDGKQTSSGYYKKPFIYGTSANIAENVKISVDSRPFVKETTPKTNEEVLDTYQPQISATILNTVEGMKVELTMNGVAYDMVFAGGKATFTPDKALQEGKVSAKISITDASGTAIADDYEWSFYIGEAQYKHYYGQIHSHTDFSDGVGTPANAMEYAKQADQIDFFALTDHSNYFDKAGNLGTFEDENSGLRSQTDVSKSKWMEYKEIISSYASADFLPIYGFEMTWTKSGANYGHINTFNTFGFVSRNDPEFDNKQNSAGLISYYEALTGLNNSFSQFNHPGSTFGTFDDFGHYDPRYDKELNLVEVGNGEGPIHGEGYYPSYEQYTNALDKGWHVAPSNNQDNHKGKWGDANDARNVAIADSLTFAGIMDAVDNHRWYATEDKNLKIDYELEGNIMGSKLEIADGQEMNIKVEISDPDTTDTIGKVEVISNGGAVLGSEVINSNSGAVSLTIPNQGTYYYIKVTQADADIAVTAPVWTKKVAVTDIDSVVKDTAVEEVGEPVTITTTFNNQSENDITASKVEYVVKETGKVLKTVESGIPTLTKKQKTEFSETITPETAGKQTLEIRIYPQGSTSPYTKEIKLNVYPKDMEVTYISEVQKAEEGKQFMIEGTLTSNASDFDKNTAFLQDSTAGINIFPISNDFEEGTRVRIKGYTSSYQGEHQLNVDHIEKIDGPVTKVQPEKISTGEVKNNLGLLVKVVGEVKEVKKDKGVISSLILDDGSGSIRVFIDGYIGKTKSDDKTMPDFKVGDKVEATGLSSIDPEGNRIRIRNREDVKPVVEKPDEKPENEFDKTAPEIKNVFDKTYFYGEKIDLLSKVYAVDDRDGIVAVEVNPAEIDSRKPGVYKVVYTARDSAGNIAEKSIFITVEERNEDKKEGFYADEDDDSGYIIPTPVSYPTGNLVEPTTTNKMEVEDIKGHWAEDVIKEVLKRGLMDLKNGKFMPDTSTSRIDMVKAIAKLENVNPKDYMGKSLSDIDPESIESGYVNWNIEKGIIDGYEDGTFRPEGEITREEIAKILNKYVENLNKDFPLGNLIDFKDSAEIADWAKEDVNKAVARGLLRGRDTGEFDPKGNLTRAEVAQILYNIFSK